MTRNFVLGVLLVWMGVASSAQAANMYFIHSDHLGTPQALSDEQGDVVWQGVYSPFGELVASEGVIEPPLRFPGQYADQETGLYYNYFRDYDPRVGRYVESDPIGLNGGLNTYAYVGGNPIQYSDPTGLLAPQVVGAILGGFTGGVGAFSAAFTGGETNGSNLLVTTIAGAGVGALIGAGTLNLGVANAAGSSLAANLAITSAAGLASNLAGQATAAYIDPCASFSATQAVLSAIPGPVAAVSPVKIVSTMLSGNVASGTTGALIWSGAILTPAAMGRPLAQNAIDWGINGLPKGRSECSCESQ